MKLRVTFEKKEHVLDVGSEATVTDVLQGIGINPEMVIVSKNGKFVPETEPIGPRDKIDVLKVISGG